MQNHLYGAFSFSELACYNMGAMVKKSPLYHSIILALVDSKQASIITLSSCFL